MKPENTKKIRILIVEDQFIEAHDLEIIIEKAGYEVIGIARSYNEAMQFLEEDKPDLVLLDIFLKGTGTGIDLAKKLKEINIGFIFVSANSGEKILSEAKKTQPYGFIVKPFREEDIITTLEIACYRQKFSLESQLKQSNFLNNRIEQIIATSKNSEDALMLLGDNLQSYLPFDYLEVGVLGKVYTTHGLTRKNFEEYQILTPSNIAKISSVNINELAVLQNNTEEKNEENIYLHTPNNPKLNPDSYKRVIMRCFGIRSFLSLVIESHGEKFTFCFYSRQDDIYHNEHLALLKSIEDSLTKFALAKIKKCEIADANKVKKTSNKALYTEFKGIIGNSKSIFTVFDHIKKVAPSDTSVLILGESGTGKEKIAKSIHELSPRKDNPLITINCGAIPENLAESILFGHEKGSFTGAGEMRQGKFELADGGTIFLDEVGELSNEMQIKLLRVLQEKEIERIGSKYQIPVNVRIISATNRNLEQEVAAGRFRLDLYYRLHVFPISIPPLRQRREDIVDLANHFISLYCKQNSRKNMTLGDNATLMLMKYDWPGNVRELENVMYRSILLADDDTINVIHLSNFGKIAVVNKTNNFSDKSLKTFEQNERDYINYVLEMCNGKIYGVGGAAEVLNIPPTTLHSKIKKLGIR